VCTSAWWGVKTFLPLERHWVGGGRKKKHVTKLVRRKASSSSPSTALENVRGGPLKKRLQGFVRGGGFKASFIGWPPGHYKDGTFFWGEEMRKDTHIRAGKKKTIERLLQTKGCS